MSAKIYHLEMMATNAVYPGKSMNYRSILESADLKLLYMFLRESNLHTYIHIQYIYMSSLNITMPGNEQKGSQG